MRSIFQKIKVLPRWIILLIDLNFLFVAFLLAYFLRFNFRIDEILEVKFHAEYGVLIYLACQTLSISLTQSYAGIIRHTSMEDGVSVVRSAFMGTLLFLLINFIHQSFADQVLAPLSVVIISFFIAVLFLVGYRLIIKGFFAYFTEAVHLRKSALIFGAGKLGRITKDITTNPIVSGYRIIAYLDDDPTLAGKKLGGVPVEKGKRLEQLLLAHKPDELIISTSKLSLAKKNQIVDACLKYHVVVREVPPVESWVRGELSLNQIKQIRIEDLLGRETIRLFNPEIKDEIEGKKIMVTGAAGSIGSEIVRQVKLHNPSLMILADQAESPLYELIHELGHSEEIEIVDVLVDIRNKTRLDDIFSRYRPEMVFHAAAYKHVPIMEHNPSEAVDCNIRGTKNLADLSVKHGVKKFVMISTDKVVNPTGVMGASKRIAEMYVQALNTFLLSNNSTSTRFITTRFGNVLGSSGSVIPLFKNQIQRGGPITVTHPDVQRFFMTIPEACQLVLEASCMGKGGEIYVFDMGEPMKILDLARKMIQLSGLEVDKDIKIEFTGLRPGEKMLEELLDADENILPTYHSKIKISRVREMDYKEIRDKIERLIAALDDIEDIELVKAMKALVPEFRSNQSRFEVLDKDSESSPATKYP